MRGVADPLEANVRKWSTHRPRGVLERADDMSVRERVVLLPRRAGVSAANAQRRDSCVVAPLSILGLQAGSAPSAREALDQDARWHATAGTRQPGDVSPPRLLSPAPLVHLVVVTAPLALALTLHFGLAVQDARET